MPNVNANHTGKWNDGDIQWRKNFDDMFSHFNTIPACDRQTDRHVTVTTRQKRRNCSIKQIGKFLGIAGTTAWTFAAGLCLFFAAWVIRQRI